jgi:hypothetical protein
MNITRLACVATLSLFVAAGAACNSSHTTSTTSDPALSHVDLALDASNREVVVGDTITVTARTEDTYGRNSQIKWNSTAGNLDTEQEGRVARIRFDQPGTYTVSAILSVDGKETRRASVDIHVKPLS